MISTLIIDDEPLARKLIRTLLASHQEIEIVGEARDGNEAAEQIQKQQPDLVFLDIEMPGASGVDVVAGLPKEIVPHVIFVTAYDRYAIKAFELHAIDYVLKPFEEERFHEAVELALSRIRESGLAEMGRRVAELAESYGVGSKSTRPSGHLIIRDNERVRSVSFDDIIWVEAARQYAKVHTTNEKHVVSRSLAALESELTDRRFVRIHRSALVNTAFVIELRSAGDRGYFVMLSNGERLKLSRRRRNALADLLPGLST